MKKMTQRNYAMQDDAMLSESKTTLTLAKQDFEAISAVDPSITVEVINKNLKDADICLDDFTSLGGRNTISITTDIVQSVLHDCREELGFFYFHLDRAFPDDPFILTKFGKNGYDKARNNPEKMISLLSLVIAGYGEVSIEKVLTARLGEGYKAKLVEMKERLAKDALEQSLAKSKRIAETESRITRYNTLWDFVRKVSEAAKVAFRNSPAKQQQYKLYDTPSKKDDKKVKVDDARKGSDLDVKDDSLLS